jgi:hypothetical protein
MFHEPVGVVDRQQMEIIRKNMMTVFRSLSKSSSAIEDVRRSAGLGAGLEEMPFRRPIVEDRRSENVATFLYILLTISRNLWEVLTTVLG